MTSVEFNTNYCCLIRLNIYVVVSYGNTLARPLISDMKQLIRIILHATLCCMVRFSGKAHAESHSGSQFGQQHGTPDRTGRPPVHERRDELQQKPVEPQVDVDVRGLVECRH